MRRVRTWLGVGLSAALLSGAGVGGLRWAAAHTPLPEGYFGEPSTVVRYRDGHPAHVFLSPDDAWRISADLDEVDPKYVEALLAFEDRRFYTHGGVDVWSIGRAVVTNLAAGRVVSGASTLTMQLARMREPKSRTLGAKLKEAFRALQIEARLSKRQILEQYLTHAPYGGNRQGIEAASRAFFGHGARRLSASEIATLIAIPQRPTPRAPSKANRERLRAARAHVRATLEGLEVLDAEDPVEPVPTRAMALPREIPHLAHALRAAEPNRLRFDTTLDRHAQATAERLVQSHRRALEREGIHNGAVVVTDPKTGDALALVGSLDFWADGHGAQIPGFFVPRSPGSTLKPFIYARALEDGLILPETLLPDVPRSYGEYRPENYDGSFDGAVTAKEALARSLNLPFVNLLQRVGLDRFVGELVTSGAAHVDDSPGQLGLSVALGSIAVSPIEIAQLYGALSADGELRRVRWLKSAPPSAPMRMWSSAAARLVRDALDDRDRPDFPVHARLGSVPSGTHWKTGTSYAHRDAWTAGGDADRTVVVWLGNVDNQPSPRLVGAKVAAPLFFDLLDGLRAGRAPPRASSPSAADPDLVRVRVCALTGALATDACPHARDALALAHRVPTDTCETHVHRWVARDSGLAANPACSAAGPVDRQTFEVWPADILQHLGPEVRQLPPPPGPDPRCAAAQARPLVISSPSDHTRLLVPGVSPSDQEVPLRADGSGELRWFVDGRYLGSSRAGDDLWWTPAIGRHDLLVMDDHGQRRHRKLWVR